MHRSMSPLRTVEGTLLTQDHLLDEEVDQPMRPDVDLRHFAYHKKLKDFKKEKVLPIHMLLRMKVIAKKRSFPRTIVPYRAKSASPYHMHYFGDQ